MSTVSYIDEKLGVSFGDRVNFGSHQIEDGLTMEDHFQRGLDAVNPFDNLAKLPPYLEEVVQVHENWSCKEILRFRELMMSHLKSYVEAPEQRLAFLLWQQARPEHCRLVNPSLNGPFLFYLMSLCQLPVEPALTPLFEGFPLTGSLSALGLWNKCEFPATMTAEDLGKSSKERFPATVSSIQRQTPEMKDLVYAATMKELDLNILEGPYWIDNSVDDLEDLFSKFKLSWSECNFTGRKGVPHNSGDGSARPVDDCRRSLLNLTAHLLERAFLPTLGMYAVVIARIMAIGSHALLFAGDHLRAYKMWPSKLTDIYLCWLLAWNPKRERPECFLHRSLTFGSLGSVWGYCGVSLLIGLICSKLLLVIIVAYVDDFLGCDSLELAQSAFECFEAVHRWCGIVLKPGKQVSPRDQMVALGLRVLIRSHHVLVAPTQKRRNQLCELLISAITDRKLVPKVAKRLGGLGSFLSGALWGRSGRIALSVVWQYCRNGSSSAVGAGSVVALRVLRALAKFGRPRSLDVNSLKPKKRATMWLDGFWSAKKSCGGIGGVVVLQNEQGHVEEKFAFLNV